MKIEEFVQSEEIEFYLQGLLYAWKLQRIVQDDEKRTNEVWIDIKSNRNCNFMKGLLCSTFTRNYSEDVKKESCCKKEEIE